MGEQMSRIAYYRCSTGDQSIEAQRNALGGSFDREFSDIGVSGAVLAEDRSGFSDLLKYIREGDSLGRPMAADAAAVVEWRRTNSATIRQTCEHFNISKATVTRYCSNAPVTEDQSKPSSPYQLP